MSFWRGQQVLVTGGAGFIGSNLVDALVAAGSQVTVLDDLSVGKRDNVNPAARLVEGSILDRAMVGELVTSASVVFHLAVACLRVCFDRPHHVHDVNATGTLNLLQEIQDRNSGLKRFVYVSSSEVYGTAIEAPMTEEHPLNPTTVYGASKLAGELYTQAYFRTYAMPTVIARPFNTYGYREHHEGASGEVIPRFMVRIVNDMAPVIFGDGEQTRDFTFVSDTVAGLMKAAECEALVGDCVNIARGEEVTIRRIGELLLQITGRTDLVIQQEDPRPADVLRHYANVGKAERLLGFRAPVGIEAGLQLYVDWFRKNHQDHSGLLAQMQDRNWLLKETATP